MFIEPKGFTFSSMQAGFKYQGRDDLALIVSQVPATGAGLFTRNRFKAAPVLVARDNLSGQQSAGFRAILVNAGQANACTGAKGLEDCRQTLKWSASLLGCRPEEILPASTGVIGERLFLPKWEDGLKDLVSGLGQKNSLDVAKAMMTTDTFPKLVCRVLEYSGQEVCLLGMCKGAGMICPNMATMLSFVLTDAHISASLWQEFLCRAVEMSFNRITVDGDTSTNDCVLGLANGQSKVEVTGPLCDVFYNELEELCQDLAYLIVQDAEGGTKVVRIQVCGAKDDRDAEDVARTIAHSPLVKTAIFGQDPNWGRIIAALGRCSASFSPERVRVSICGLPVFVHGQPASFQIAGGMDFDALLKPYLKRDELEIQIDLDAGQGSYALLTSDLTDEYIHINADYRS